MTASAISAWLGDRLLFQLAVAWRILDTHAVAETVSERLAYDRSTRCRDYSTAGSQPLARRSIERVF